MIHNKHWLTSILVMTLVAGGCGKKEEPAPAAASDPAPAPAVSESAPAATQNTQGAATDERAAAIQAALAEDAIVNDPRGQWAVSASASSTYGDKEPDATTSYTAHMATGAPNVEKYSDNGNAWAAETADKGIEWLEVKFAKPVNATQIRIRQNYAPGAIIKVELISEGGSRQTVWQGVDDQSYPQSTIAWFDRTFDKTSDKVIGARITLATNAVSGWNEIDAVQLLGD